MARGLSRAASRLGRAGSGRPRVRVLRSRGALLRGGRPLNERSPV